MVKRNRKICVVTGSRAEYGLLKFLIDGINNCERLELILLVTGTHLSKEFGFDPSQMADFNPGDMAAFDADKLADFDPQGMKGFDSDHLAAFDPGFRPNTRKSVLLETCDEIKAPTFSDLFFISVLDKYSNLPVKTSLLP